MGRDHLRDLVRVEAGIRREEARGGQVPPAPVAPGDRLVGDPLHERLQEAELAALGGERIGLEGKQFLAHEAADELLHVLLAEAGERGKTPPRERLAEHRRVLQELPLGLRHRIETGGDQRMERLGHLQRRQVACDDGCAVDLLQQPSVEQHPHRLDGVQRDAVRGLTQPVPGLLREAGDEAGEEVVHGVVAERLERQGGRASGRPREAGMAVGQLRPRQREHEDRVLSAPVEQVLDECHEPLVGPVDVLEHQHERPLLGQALEEAAPGGEQILAIGSAVLGQA